MPLWQDSGVGLTFWYAPSQASIWSGKIFVH